MAVPPRRERDTRELIERLQASRARRKRMRLVMAGLGGLAVVAIVVGVVVLSTRGSDDQASAGSTTVPASGGVGATGTTAATPGATGTTSTSTDTTATTAGATTGSSATTMSAVSTTAPTTSTSLAPTTTSASSTTSTTAARPAGLVVVIDPGHQAKGDSSLEPVGPGSTEKKAKVTSGTAGAVTGTPESELVLAVSLKLRDSLAAHGIKVVMTRTTQDVNLSNIQRAQIANQAGADLFVRIHADGSDDSSIAGIHVLYPASIQGWTDDIATASKKAATLAQKELVAATGAKDRGIDARSDMTGFNWADVPVILPEIGFMTNVAEDRLLATPAYQDKIVAGLTKAILSFLGVS
jgi:N-acetylmuramoyl-L-alanine amidase